MVLTKRQVYERFSGGRPLLVHWGITRPVHSDTCSIRVNDWLEVDHMSHFQVCEQLHCGDTPPGLLATCSAFPQRVEHSSAVLDTVVQFRGYGGAAIGR